MTTKFILISGKKENGKDYFADVLEEMLTEFNYTHIRTAFANPIKDFCHNVFGVSYEDMSSPEGKRKSIHLRWSDLDSKLSEDLGQGVHMLGGNWFPSQEFLTIRDLLQVIGTDVWRNKFYNPIWAEAPFRKSHPEDVVIITDCRFPNEVEEGKKYNSIFVRVDGGKVSDDNHSSETALDEYEWNTSELYEHTFDGVEPIKQFIGKNIIGKLSH